MERKYGYFFDVSMRMFIWCVVGGLAIATLLAYIHSHY